MPVAVAVTVGGSAVGVDVAASVGVALGLGVMVGVARTLTPGFSVFGEGVTAVLADRPDVWTVDAGWAWVTRPNVQWDMSAGHSFNRRGDAWFVSGGLTLRRLTGRTRVSSTRQLPYVTPG